MSFTINGISIQGGLSMATPPAPSTSVTARYWRLYQDTATLAASPGYEWHINSFTMTGTYQSNGSPATATTLNTTASSIRSNGDISSFFLSNTTGIFNSFQAGQYLLTDYGTPATITAATLRNAIGPNWAPTQFSIQYSSNNVDWATILTVANDGNTTLKTLVVQ